MEVSGTNKMRTDMKKTFKFFAAALAIVAAASCAKELANDDATQTPEAEQELVHKVFSASLNVDPETKTTLHTDGVTVHWTEGDKITILPEGGFYANGTFSVMPETIDGTYAAFEGYVANANNYVGIYPSTMFHDTQASGSGTPIYYFQTKTLANQYAQVGNFPTTKYGSANLAISTTSASDANESRLYFQNINAYFKFKLAIDNAAEIVISADAISDASPASKSTTTRLNLGTQLRYRDGYTYGSNGDDPIIFKVDDNKTAFEKDAVYYVAMPAVYMKGLSFVVKDKDGDELISFSKSEFTAEPNQIYNIGTLDIVKPHVGDFFYSDGTFSTELDNTKTVVGVVFFAGDPTADDTTLAKDYPKCKNGLVVGLTQQSTTLGTQSISWEVSGFMTTIGVKYNRGVVRVEPAASLKTGYNNTKAFEIVDYNGSGLIYCRQMPSVVGASRWFIPTIAEFDVIRSGLSAVNASIAKVGGTKLDLAYATVTAEDNTYSALYNINSGALSDMTKRSSGAVRPIFAF